MFSSGFPNDFSHEPSWFLKEFPNIVTLHEMWHKKIHLLSCLQKSMTKVFLDLSLYLSFMVLFELMSCSRRMRIDMCIVWVWLVVNLSFNLDRGYLYEALPFVFRYPRLFFAGTLFLRLIQTQTNYSTSKVYWLYVLETQHA